jgi:tetratricopeptide (TPR) repeat protein
MADYDRAVQLDPKDAGSLNQACWIRAFSKRDLTTARADCEAAVRLSNNNPNTLNSLGLVGLQQEQWASAWASYDAAAKADPANAGNLYGRGMAALRLGRAQDGAADVAAALKLDPTIADTFAGYGIKP